MLEIHELQGRDIDPIEDIRRRFEDYYTEYYFDPEDGDYLSDDYRSIIDLTTKPGALSQREEATLNLAIAHLNDQYPDFERRLGTCLFAVYNDVAEQINSINSADPSRADVMHMQSVPVEEAA